MYAFAIETVWNEMVVNDIIAVGYTRLQSNCLSMWVYNYCGYITNVNVSKITANDICNTDSNLLPLAQLENIINRSSPLS